MHPDPPGFMILLDLIPDDSTSQSESIATQWAMLSL